MRTKPYSVTTGLFCLTIFSGLILSSTPTSATTTNTSTDDVAINIPVACTLNASGNTSHSTSIVNVTYEDEIGTTTLDVTCNDGQGFAIYAVGYTGNEIGATNSTKLVGTVASSNATITTGTATTAGNPDISTWAMKLNTTTSPTPTYPVTIDNSFNAYHAVTASYTKVAHRDSGTDAGTGAEGSTLTTTYAAYISKTQAPDTYTGQVKYTLVHPSTADAPPQPQTATSGCINYFANASDAVGTMGCQSVPAYGPPTVIYTLLASNFSRTGYGFAGWSDSYDYATNPNAKFYGPNENITVTTEQYNSPNNGLSLYAVWVKSAGNFQDSSKVAELCGTGSGSLTAATYSDEGDSDESTWSIAAGFSSVSALTDTRDNQTYAIAKLTDGKCWMIENLRLDNTAELTTLNTNNPLNDGTSVTLKHNYTDTITYNTLSATSNVAYDADTAPDGWCTTDSADCQDQSRLQTDNTVNRANNPNSNSSSMYSYGNYYNWYSATAGNGTHGKSGTTDGDLCPMGWHLPYGGSATGVKGGNTAGGFYYLANSMIATTGSAINSNKYRTFPNNFIYSGYRTSSSGGRGEYGYYWSSTAWTNGGAYGLYLYSYYIQPGTSSRYNQYGDTVRCVFGM